MSKKKNKRIRPPRPPMNYDRSGLSGYEIAEREKERQKMYLFGLQVDVPQTCAVFGCGRHLTISEKLFGNKCIHHQQRKHENIEGLGREQKRA